MTEIRAPGQRVSVNVLNYRKIQTLKKRRIHSSIPFPKLNSSIQPRSLKWPAQSIPPNLFYSFLCKIYIFIWNLSKWPINLECQLIYNRSVKSAPTWVKSRMCAPPTQNRPKWSRVTIAQSSHAAVTQLNVGIVVAISARTAPSSSMIKTIHLLAYVVHNSQFLTQFWPFNSSIKDCHAILFGPRGF